MATSLSRAFSAKTRQTLMTSSGSFARLITLHACITTKHCIHVLQPSIAYMYYNQALHACITTKHCIHVLQPSIAYMYYNQALHTCITTKHCIHVLQPSIAYMYYNQALHNQGFINDLEIELSDIYSFLLGCGQKQLLEISV